MSRRAFDDPHGNSDAARKALLDGRCERNHPKRHRTKNRSKRLSAEKRKKIAGRLAAMAAARGKYLSASRAYWAGERNNHP